MAPAGRVPSPARSFGLNRRLRRWLATEVRASRPVVEASAAARDAEHAREHFPSSRHPCLLLSHGPASHPSLHQGDERFAACRGPAAAGGLGGADGTDRLGVGSSHPAASHGTRPAAVPIGVVSRLLTRLRQDGLGARPAGDPVLGSLIIQASTFRRVSRRPARWLPTLRRPDGSGVRVQARPHPRPDLPEVVHVTSRQADDCQSRERAVPGDPTPLRDPRRSPGPDRRRGRPGLPLAPANRALPALVDGPAPAATAPRPLRERRRALGRARHPGPPPDPARRSRPRPRRTLPAPPRSSRGRLPPSRPHPRRRRPAGRLAAPPTGLRPPAPRTHLTSSTRCRT